MASKVIGVLNIGIGNIASVCNLIGCCGYDYMQVETPEMLDDASHLIMPGVGHFGTAMRVLNDKGVVPPIAEFAASGRPVLGICLGMQLLVESGTEGGDTAGLGLIPGTVVRMNAQVGERLPHVGWNNVDLLKVHPVTAAVSDHKDYYFTHSYHVRTSDAHVVGTTPYAGGFTSVIARDNVIGMQFHPEKSLLNGEKLMMSFCKWDGTC